MSVPVARCPRDARTRILSSFRRLCREHLGSPPQSGHPRSVDLLWRSAGGQLGTALARCERVVQEAADRGYRAVSLAAVASRRGS
jgi:hypothetical protein